MTRLGYPAWVDQLGDPETGEICGPALGAALLAQLQDGSCTPLQLVTDILYNVREVNIPGAIGPGVPYTAKFIPGQTGYCPIDAFATPLEESIRKFPFGPAPGCAEIVVVGKRPGETEHQLEANCVGESGRELKRSLQLYGIEGFLDKAYFTNLCRFLPPHGKYKQSWINECAWFLWAELVVIRPKLLILLGSEAIKYFHGRGASVTKTRAQVKPIEVTAADGKFAIQTLSTMNPAAVLREPSLRDGFARDLANCVPLVSGGTIEKFPCQYDEFGPHLRTVDDVRKYVESAILAGRKKFAIDCEWSGRSLYSGGKLLTVQLSYGAGNAVLIVVSRHPRIAWSDIRDGTWQPGVHRDTIVFDKGVSGGGKPAVGYVRALTENSYDIDRSVPVEVLTEVIPNFSDGELVQIVGLLNELLCRDGVRVGGHSFRADFPWLKAFGVDLTEQYTAGFDTILEHHLLCESVPQDLSSVALKYTDVGRYDTAVHEWTGSYRVSNDGGYGNVPEHILYLYALRDVDVTFRISECTAAELAGAPELRRLARAELRACAGILEIEEHGLQVDRARIRQLAALYADKRDELMSELRISAKWAGFNPRSVCHARELLFGEHYNGKKRTNPLEPERQRPDGAVCCKLTPVKSTGKPPQDWSRLVSRDCEMEFVPSTDKESLGILAEAHPIADLLRKFRFVDQVCKNFTSMPKIGEDGVEVVGGLEQHINLDGRIRTHIIQTLETGRWASRGPNLQNIPKSREPELQRMFPPDEPPPKIRSVFMASAGNVLLEADYMQAELIVLALLSGDAGFWNVLTSCLEIPVLFDINTGEPYRWLHPDWVRGVDVNAGDVVPAGAVFGSFLDHDGRWKACSTAVNTVVKMVTWPRDLHAEVAISGFRMSYSPVMDGPAKDFVNARAREKRVAAKTVNFGIPYGRSAAAIQRQLRQDGVSVTVGDCQDMIDGFLTNFPRVAQFLRGCSDAVTSVGYLVNPFGRRRRFSQVEDDSALAAQQREARNFPIQSTVADCLNLAVFNCWHHRNYLRRTGIDLKFKIALGVHDALIFDTAAECVHALMRDGGFIDRCMSDYAPIPLPDRTVCGGLYRFVDVDKFPYAIKVEKSLYLRWDERPSQRKDPAAYAAWEQTLCALGVPAQYIESDY